MRVIYILILMGLFVLPAQAQKLTIPEGINKSYTTKGTRQMNGKPGKNYWQNRGRYYISITVAPPDKVIRGVEQITYFNNSPDRLDSLNMKLIVNYRRKTGPNHIIKPELGITVDELKVNGANAVWDNNAATTTNYMLPLSKPLMPHDSIKMDIKWHYQLTEEQGRDGVLDSTTYFLAYFYPRVSVYDDYQGWDIQPHVGHLEFYNDFNDYTLNVTVPKHFLVWATGDLRNTSQVLQPEFTRRYKQSLSSDSTVHVVTNQDLKAKRVTNQNATNTWTFTANNISDVTTAISDSYVWDAASVVVDDVTKRRVSVQAAFPDTSADFHHSVQFSRYALGWFSRNWPGVPYPFSKSTAVQGFADMEYPMMVNDSHQTDLGFAELVQDHEQAHTYFPFYMGINESRYAFMDEGWATTLEYLIGISTKGKEAADKFYKAFRVNSWAAVTHAKEQPIITPSDETFYNVGDNFYGKPSLSYLALKDMLGDKLFKKALHTYMNNWHGKHPIPWDYFNAMQAGAGKNLDWFFYNWFYTPYYIDISLNKPEKTGNGYQLFIKNIGGFAIPFDVNITYTDGSIANLHQTPIVWKQNQKEIILKIKADKTIKNITLDTGIFVDSDATNNTWSAM